MKRSRDFAVIGLLALVVGLSVFAVSAWNAVDVSEADAGAALQAFAEARRPWAGRAPMVSIDATGRVVRTGESGNTDGEDAAPAHDAAEEPSTFHVLAYLPREGTLVSVEMPFWFLSMKGPAVAMVLRRTRFDPNAVGLTADDLRAFGPGLILDEDDLHGVRLLVWQE